MDLKTWLDESGLMMKDLGKMIGAGRTTMWKAAKGVAIEKSFAERIFFMSGGKVKLPHVIKGRKKGFKVKK